MSVEYLVRDEGRPHTAWLSGGSGGRGLEGAEQALVSTTRLKEMLSGRIEVATPVHAWTGGTAYPNGSIFERYFMLQNRQPGDRHPFVDRESFDMWLTRIQANAVAHVEQERLAAAGLAPAPGGGD
jgi:hypothetical protein